MRCDRFDGFPCLTDGKADAHVLCVRPALKHPNVTLRTHAKVERLETDASGRTINRVVVDRRGVERDVHRRHRRRVVRRRELGGAAAALGLRQAPERPRELVRRRRPPLHGAPQLRRDRDLADPERDEVPEDARDQRLLLGRRGLRPPARAHPDARQVRPQHPARRRAVVRARPRARLHGQARDRLLAHDRGPPAPDNRVTVDRHGDIHLSKTYYNTEPHKRLLRQAEGAARAARLPRDGDPALVGARPADPARRHRAQLRHRALRRRIRRGRRSTSTARRTTSTTSTSSTPASSPPRAR